MNYLALDSATWTLTLALGDAKQVKSEVSIQVTKGHSTLLVPCIDRLLSAAQMEARDLAGIVVGQGPGSYTGVRIGVSVAKSMAWALGIPLAGVSSLDGLAGHFGCFHGRVVCMFDARRRRCYSAVYEADGMGNIRKTRDDQVVSVESLCRGLSENDRPTLFAGDGAVRWRADIEANYTGHPIFVRTPAKQQVRAAHLLPQGCAKIVSGQADDVHLFRPRYLQMVEAEQKWLSEHGNGEVFSG